MPSEPDSLRDAARRPYWLDDPDAPEPLPPLDGDAEADLIVVGGGYSGLWTALIAKERDPSRDVLLLEGAACGWAASGRNGGFCAASLTHGYENGLARWPGEIDTLERLGMANLDAIEAAVERYGIDCGFERTGEIVVATEPWQVDELREGQGAGPGHDLTREFLDREAVRAEVDSPTYLAGLWEHDGVAMVSPARLAWGLRRACLGLGVRIHERTPVRSISGRGGALSLVTPYGRASAPRVAWGTGAFPGPLRRLRQYVAPVYDYALMTERLSEEQRAAIGWRNRQGLSDSANQFHYYRLTADGGILWGGYDAIYHLGNRVALSLEQRDETFRRLASHFFETFPQLRGLRFTHRWGGVIDTCTRFSAFFGRAYGGRLAYAAGYTGLGVGATRFGAEVMLDLLDGVATERAELEMVRTKPLPFPPEPLRFAGIQLTRRALAAADRNGGRRNLWLRTLDRFGLGFDS